MRIVPEKVHITINRGEKTITHDELLRNKSFPPVLLQFLNMHPQRSDGSYFASLSEARQLSAAIRPHQTDSFQLDTTEIDQFQTIDCPANFKIHWQFDASHQTLKRKLIEADGYLGEGWFFQGKRSWQIALPLTPDILRWLALPEIESESLYPFATKGFPLFSALEYQCDLAIESNFQAKLQILKTLKQSMTIQITSNMPELLGNLAVIRGDHQNLISGLKLLPGWSPKLRGNVLHLAKSARPMQIDGQKLLTFIQDDLSPVAADLGVDWNMLRAAYPIDDAAQIPVKWILEHRVTQGLGRYYAVPCLKTLEETIPIQKIASYVEKGNRFLQVRDRWLEFTPRFKDRYQEWRRKNLAAVQLAPQEIMGTNNERLAKMGLQSPVIKVSNADTERDQVIYLIDTMRQHGLPVGIYGLQKEISDILANRCHHFLSENHRANILWLMPGRRIQEASSSLKHGGVPFTTQAKPANGRVLLTSPENLEYLNHDWSLVIFSDLDILAAGEKQSKALTALRYTWSISTFSRPDWHQDIVRAQRVLRVLRLTRNDLSVFVRLCTGTYTKQADNLLSRLTSPFKRIFASPDLPSESAVSGDIPIPPRHPQSEPRPIKKTEAVYRPDFKVSVTVSTPRSSFLEQAKRLANHVERTAEPVPFMQYWPTYDSMINTQKKWYFYWRSQARQGNYLPIDLSYLFVHVYEVIHLIGVENAQSGADYLINLWQQYRLVHAKLDRYLIDWIADFHIVYKLAQTPLEWYMTAVRLGGEPTDQNLTIEAWLSRHEDINLIPDSLLNLISDYKPAKSKFFQQYNEDKSVEQDLRKSLRLIDDFTRQKEGKSLFEHYRPEVTQVLRRQPFASAIYEGKRDEIMIATVPMWSDASRLRSSVTAILKYTENLLRRQHNFRGTLRGIEISDEWAKILDGAFSLSSEEPSTTIAIDYAKVSALQMESDEVRDRLLVEDEDEPGITIDYAKVSTLNTESDAVRDRLLVEDETGTLAQPVSASASELPAAVTGQSGHNLTFNVARPLDTPAPLLTDLEAVHTIIASDQKVQNLLIYLKQNDWEVETDAVYAVLEGEFLSIILDRINERALDQLGDQLIIIENDTLVVTEDYRDELEHLFQNPASEITPTTPKSGAEDSELTPEWAGFVRKMQSHHWEALHALLIQEDVSARLDGIARSAYTTPDLLIDEINEFALENIGDIVIETGETPAIEEEDLEDLRLLMSWALENVIQEI